MRRADALTHRLQRRQIFFQSRVTEPQLDCFETALCQAHRLIRNVRRRHQAEAARIVGADRARRAAKHRCKRQPRGDGERIPHRRIQSGQGHARGARDPDQRKMPRQFGRDFSRAHLFALDQRHRILKQQRNRAGATGPVAEQIGSARDAFFSFKIDQQQRRFGDSCGTGPERISHWYKNRCRADGRGSSAPELCSRPSAVAHFMQRQNVGDCAVERRRYAHGLCQFHHTSRQPAHFEPVSAFKIMMH